MGRRLSCSLKDDFLLTSAGLVLWELDFCLVGERTSGRSCDATLADGMFKVRLRVCSFQRSFDCLTARGYGIAR